MDQIDENDCNSKELARLLVGSIQRLLNNNQWNGFTRLQAIEDPFRFIDDVDKHINALEREEEDKGNLHIRITDVSDAGKSNKITCIKTIRVLMGWGLADSKYSFEALPSGSGFGGASPAIKPRGFTIVSRAFSSMEELQKDDFYQNRHLFVYDTPRLPSGTSASKPANSP